MNDEDCIRKALELVDGDYGDWFYRVFGEPPIEMSRVRQAGLDALAAQLARQVDEREQPMTRGGAWVDIHCYRPPDRTMNTIRVIVDSGVLAREW